MIFPTISQYIESIAEPHGLFRTLGEIEAERDIFGRPKVFVGGKAAVFKIIINSKPYALKCYTRPSARSRRIYKYISQTAHPLLCLGEYLDEELFVYDSNGIGRFYDVCLSEWFEGRTLDFEIQKALHDNDCIRLAELARTFDHAAIALLEQPWAHGDLKPENIIIKPDGGIGLIDYDAMFIPYEYCGKSNESGENRQCNRNLESGENLESGGSSEDGQHNGNSEDIQDGKGRQDFCTDEIGTPQYQHPMRNCDLFDKSIDDYPIATISATLHTLASDIRLNSLHGNSDYFLFHPEEITGYKAALQSAAKCGNVCLYSILRALQSPTPKVKGLKEILKHGIRANVVASEPLISTTQHRSKQNNKESIVAPELFEENGSWGYASNDESTAVIPVFDWALEFSEGLAAVSLNGTRHFIDSTGRCVINCSEYEAIKSFSEGFAAVCKGGLWGYIDQQGTELIPCRYTKASSARNGTAKISNGVTETILNMNDI